LSCNVDECKTLGGGGGGGGGAAGGAGAAEMQALMAAFMKNMDATGGANGRAVKVDPIKPTLKAPGTERLDPRYVGVLHSFAFKFNLRRYITAVAVTVAVAALR
jgi:hypothetical protein